MKLKGFAFIILVMMILASGGMASGQCDPSDGNNTEADATQIGFSETVSDWVCPDDPFDFYILEIPEGADFSGSFTFSSPQRSTVLRIEHADTGVRVIDDAFTTDERREFTVRVAAGTVPHGTYYARVFFWSDAAFDHEYSLTIDLSVTGLPECVPDGNEDAENASETSFGNTVADWVCSDDHLDIWHFAVATDAEGNGTINLTADPGEIILYLYDSTEEELFRGRTSDGVLEYDLNSGGAPLVAGDYYIGVFLPFARDDENAYTLALYKYIVFMPVGELLTLESGLSLLLPEESQPEFQLQVRPEFQLQTYQPEIFTRIVVDSLYCVSESTWDHITDSDEPYAVIDGFATHTEPHAWYTGRPQVFGDVDDRENRRFTRPQRLVFEGDVPPDAVIGFTVVLMEQDASGSSIFDRIGDAVADNIGEVIAGSAAAGGIATGGPVGGVAGGIAGGVAAGVIWALAEVLDSLAYLFGGGSDDKVAEATVVVDYDDLEFYSGELHKTMETRLYGGSSGKYILRWHLEFDPLASIAFNAEFTGYDAFAVGKLWAGSEDVILTVIDEDAPGNNGRFYIRNALGFLLTKFDAFYTHYDRVVCGDINGDGTDEIVVASDDGGGKILAYDSNGVPVMSFDAPYTKYDGLAVANVYGDEKCEILLARDDDNRIFTYDKRGTKLREMHMTTWDFEGVRNTHENTRHDEFLVGDVMGSGDLEIVMLENKNGLDSLVHIYAANGTSGQTLRRLRLGDMGGIFTKYDAACLADITGDEKLELIIGTDGGDKENGLKVMIYDLWAGSIVATRYWPMYTKYDGFAAGDVLGSGKDQILLATDEDNKVYISK